MSFPRLEPLLSILDHGVPISREGIERLSKEIKEVEKKVREPLEKTLEITKEYQMFGILSTLLYLKVQVSQNDLILDQNAKIIKLLEERKKEESLEE